ncbi:MAG: HalX domain-containing protein [Halobacteriales archaeon]|nr:HalX domain-containing protein [Halobacteriales archaeon]
MTVVDHDAVMLAITDASRRERFSDWLAESFGVRSVAPGDCIEEQFDETITVVVVDATFPSRRELLEQTTEIDRPCQTILMAAEPRDVDRVDQPYDTVLATPTIAETLRTAVTQAFARGQHERLAREYFTLADQLTELEVERNTASTEYTSVMDRLEEIRVQLDTVCERIDDEFTVLFGEFTPTTKPGTEEV